MTLQFNELEIDGIKPDYGTYVYSAYLGDANTAKAAYVHVKAWLEDQGISPTMSLSNCKSSLAYFNDRTGEFDTALLVQETVKLEVMIGKKEDAVLFKLNFM